MPRRHNRKRRLRRMKIRSYSPGKQYKRFSDKFPDPPAFGRTPSSSDRYPALAVFFLAISGKDNCNVLEIKIIPAVLTMTVANR